MEQLAKPASSGTTLRATGLRKRFDGVEVLHGVDLELRPGEVHALVGENGAGKSTIINLLSGRLRPDEGLLELDGVPVELANPLAARRAGISVIAQELEVVPTLTIVENIFLGVEPTKFGLVRWRDARRQVVAVLRELGLNADPNRVVGTMGVADQQLVEIAKAVVGEFGVLIMDEPTSALNLEDTERLFRIVRRLKADGVAVVRDGSRILTTDIAMTDVGAVIRAMLGSRSSLIAEAGRPRAAPPAPASGGRPSLELEAVGSGELLRDISLRVDEGEVVGLAGVLGSGRTELCEAIYGLRKIESGVVRLRGQPVKLQEPKESLKRGVFLLPEDRKSEGIFEHLDVGENVILGYDPGAAEGQPADADLEVISLPPERTFRRRTLGFGPIRAGAERRAFRAMRDRLSIRCSGPDDRITALSGGNQQKALFARAALAHPSVLILSEPTRGVDVGAKEEIYAAIEMFARRGIAIIVSSSEIGELLRLANRICILRNGRIVARVASAETSEEDILRRMAG
jgi:ABC-type sugar transport system ATPase subunit